MRWNFMQAKIALHVFKWSPLPILNVFRRGVDVSCDGLHFLSNV